MIRFKISSFKNSLRTKYTQNTFCKVTCNELFLNIHTRKMVQVCPSLSPSQHIPKEEGLGELFLRAQGKLWQDPDILSTDIPYRLSLATIKQMQRQR